MILRNVKSCVSRKTWVKGNRLVEENDSVTNDEEGAMSVSQETKTGPVTN